MLTQAVFVGLLLLVLGGFFAFLTWFILRVVVPRQRPLAGVPAAALQRAELASHNHAVLVVQPGGRIEYINASVREWFDLHPVEQPSLEILARRIRPETEFLQLCAAEGQARFSLNGRPVEGVSYRVPGSIPGILVSLRRPEIGTGLSSEDSGLAGSALRIMTDFAQAVSVKQGVPDTVQAILENVERLVPSEALKLTLWHHHQRQISTYHFASNPGGLRRVVKDRPVAPDGVTQTLLEQQQALLLADLQVKTALPALEHIAADETHSYLGVPLLAGGESIGTLEIGLKIVDGFSPEDLELLQLLSGQVSIALRNALLLDAQQKQTMELTGLANLAKALGLTHDPQELFNQLIQSIAPLFDVEILGFLLYNEEQHALEAQTPFIGLPDQVVRLYRVALPPESPAEEMYLRQEPLITGDILSDISWKTLGFRDYAQAASLRDGVLMPLVSSGRQLGYIQACNHRQADETFTTDELRLLNIISNQAAAIIDNVRLVQQAHQRSYRAEALRRIVSLAGSSATIDEILQYTLQEMGRLMQADVAAIYLLDEVKGTLELHTRSLWGGEPDGPSLLAGLFEDTTQYHQTITASQRLFLSNRLTGEQQPASLYQPLVDDLKFESIMLAPLVAHERGIGELLIGSRRQDLYNNTDLQLVATVAGQMAVVVEGTYLAGQTDESLRRRVDQLTSLSRLNRELSTVEDLDALLHSFYEECLRATRSSCGTIMLFDEQLAQSGKIVAFVGDAPGESLLPADLSVVQSRKPIFVADTRRSEFHPAHAGVLSELILPILHQDALTGLIHLHSSETDHYDDAALEMVQSLAASAVSALETYQRFRQQQQHNEVMSRRSGAMSRLFETAGAIGAERPIEKSLELLATCIQEATPFNVVLVSLVDPETQVQRRVAGVGMPQETLELLKARQQAWSSIGQLLLPEFKVGQGYFIPFDETPAISAEVDLVTLLDAPTSDAPNAWHPDDTLLYPLVDTEGSPIGLISLDSPRDGMRPERETLETIDVFAAQAALIIQSNYSLNTYKTRSETLRTSLERQEQLLSVSQGHLPVLLHKDLEQMISIRNLERRARRIRAGLELTEVINRQVDNQSALLALGREMLTRLEMSVAIVAENSPEGPRLLHVLGSTPRGTSPEALFGQRNPLRTSLQSGETILVMNLEQNESWRDTPLLSSMHAKGFVCLPVLLDGKPVAGVLALSAEPLPELTDEDRQVYLQISRQVSMIVQNINLLTETRRRLREVNLLLDFSRQLSGLDSDRVLQALLDSALRVVTAAHAGMVLIWDEHAKALVFKTADHYADVDSLKGIFYHPGEALPGRVFASRQPRRVDEVNFARDYNLPAEHLLRYREATAGRLPVSCLLIPIQTAEQAIGLLVLENFNTTAAFSPDDEALLQSLTQQVALALENVRLVQASQVRATQLQAITNVATTMTASLQSGQLIAGLLDQLRAILPYDTAILWLRQETRLSVAAARGFSDNEERIGLTVAVEDSELIKEMIGSRQAIIVDDVRSDPRFPVLVEHDRLAWMGIPLISKGQVVGVVALEKVEPHYYTFEHSQLITTFASQAAVSLENARLYEDSLRRAAELDQRSQRLATLNRLSGNLSGSLYEEQILRLTAEAIHQALSAERVSALTFDTLDNASLQVVFPTSQAALPLALPAAPIFSRLRETQGIFTTTEVEGEPDLEPLKELLTGTRSLLVLPMISAASLRGLIFVHMDQETRFSSNEVELARTITNQAAIALENARLYQDTVSRAEQLTAINRASYEIGLSLNPEDIYAATHQAASQLMPAESFVIALLDESRGDIEGVYLMDPGGRAPNLHIPLAEGLSGRVISTGEPILIPDEKQVQELGGRTYGEGQPRSIVAVPIIMAGKVIGMLSAQSYKPNMYGLEEQQALSTLANQAAVAIQNGRLFAETTRLNADLEQRVVERTAELQCEQHNTETLLKILTEVSASLDLDRALNRTLALLNDAIGAEQGNVLMLNQQNGTIEYRAGYGYITPAMKEVVKPTPLKAGEGLASWVIKNRQAVCIPDVRKDKRWVKLALNATHHRSVVAAPLVVGEDAIGVLMVFHRHPNYFTPEQMSLVQAIASQVAVAINNAQLYELIRDQAERLGAMLRNQQVEASRQQAILEAVADGVLVTDPGNVINFLNPSAEQILGLRSEQVLGQTLDHFVGLFGKAAQTWMQTISSWSDDPVSHQAGETFAEQLTLETGKVVLVHLAPVIWKREFLGTVSIFRDITHEVEIDRLKSEFVATVSHELRTPMTSIKGYVDILLMGAAGALSENQTHFLEIVRSNTDRLSILVNDLLDISRIEAGRVSLSLQAVDLCELSEDMISDLKRRSQEENKPLSISLDCPATLPRILGDLERVRQVLGNLVENAYHYTPANGEIKVKMEKVDDFIQVDIIDNGIGIPLADQDRIFERFFRGEDPLVLATPGTGLGLSIVSQLISMHKGRIWMQSPGVPGQGSTFSITLPIYTAEERDDKNIDR